jgi:hypothetical protein
MNRVHDPNPSRTHALLAALAKAFASSPPAGLASYGIGGASVTPAAVAAQLNTYLQAYDAVVQAEMARNVALDNRTQIEGAALTYVDQVVACVRGVLGPKNPALAALEIKPEKERTPLTSEQEAAKAAKARATRAARHTMGKRQRKAIKGQVPPTPTTPGTPAASK